LPAELIGGTRTPSLRLPIGRYRQIENIAFSHGLGQERRFASLLPKSATSRIAVNRGRTARRHEATVANPIRKVGFEHKSAICWRRQRSGDHATFDGGYLSLLRFRFNPREERLAF
jgi:hypothetical protein